MRGFRLCFALWALALTANIHGNVVWSGEQSSAPPPAPKENTSTGPAMAENEPRKIKKNPAPIDDWKAFLKAYHAIRDYLSPDDIVVPPDILEKAEIGDHFETINPDRPDTHSAYGNPDVHLFHSVHGSEASEDQLGSFGKRDGGGRRLMVTRHSAELSNALMERMREGFNQKDPVPLTEAQNKSLAKAIPELGSENFQERDRASKTILDLGIASVALLEETLKSNRDPEVALRLKSLLKKIRLAAALAGFKVTPSVPAPPISASPPASGAAQK